MFKSLNLPQTATAPFCPSEVQGSIPIPADASFWKRLSLFVGPGLLVSVGYMDPGNWATDIEAGAKYGYDLLFVVLLSSLTAIFLQCLSLRVGIVTGHDIAQLCRKQYSRTTTYFMWVLAEIAIIATDVAEVLGCALAFKLLLGCSLELGIAITALDTFLVLGLKGKGFRHIEAIILGLVMTIGICFAIEIMMAQPYWPDVLRGLIPTPEKISAPEPFYLAIGILGATVMPHNLYLHSSIVTTRKIDFTPQAKKAAIRMSTIDTVGSLFLAFFINAAILVLAATSFHTTGNEHVSTIDQAYHLLEPIAGTALAAVLFGIALLASGQSSTFTGTIAGQIILEGYLDLKIPCWIRRLITRALALIPAYIGVTLLGDNSAGKLLVFSQVILSLQLPFVVYPLIRFATNRKLMDLFSIQGLGKWAAWFIFTVISAANIWLLLHFIF